MNLKTFTAGSMAEVLALAKHDLGATAAILHTRTYRRGGVLGIGGRQVVEITATNDAPRRRLGRGRPARPLEANSSTPRRVASPDSSVGNLIRRTYTPAQSEITPIAAPSSSELAPPPLPHDPPTNDMSGQLAQEMTAVKRMVARLMREQRLPKTGGDVPDMLFDQYLFLLEQEVSEDLAEQVIEQVRDTLSPDELSDEPRVRRAILDQITRLIPVESSNEQFQPAPDGRPRTIALVGPTGVGKTTTIAKLAANLKLTEKKNVGLITLDTYRIAAVDQLRTYANIIGVPLYVALKPEELLDAIRRCADCDVVLIDTAGRSQRDDSRLEQLASFIEAADPHEVHLVLSSTNTQAVLFETIERFSRIRADRIILTKLDEAVSFGVLLNVVKKVNKRLSYVTTGQEVPHHIEPGRAERLASLVLRTGQVHEASKGGGGR